MRYHRGPCKPVRNLFYSPNGLAWMKSVKFFVSLLMQLFVLTEVKYKEMLYFSLYPKRENCFLFHLHRLLATNSVCIGSCQSWIKKKKTVETMHFPRRGGFISFLETLVVWLFVFPLQLVLISHNSIYDLGIRLIYIKVYLLLFWWDLHWDNPSQRVPRHPICRTTWFYLWCVWVRTKLSKKRGKNQAAHTANICFLFFGRTLLFFILFNFPLSTASALLSTRLRHKKCQLFTHITKALKGKRNCQNAHLHIAAGWIRFKCLSSSLVGSSKILETNYNK